MYDLLPKKNSPMATHTVLVDMNIEVESED
jgi:hypothetical protein